MRGEGSSNLQLLARVFWIAGRSDQQISRLLSCERQTVGRWRREGQGSWAAGRRLRQRGGTSGLVDEVENLMAGVLADREMPRLVKTDALFKLASVLTALREADRAGRAEEAAAEEQVRERTREGGVRALWWKVRGAFSRKPVKGEPAALSAGEREERNV